SGSLSVRYMSANNSASPSTCFEIRESSDTTKKELYSKKMLTRPIRPYFKTLRFLDGLPLSFFTIDRIYTYIFRSNQFYVHQDFLRKGSFTFKKLSRERDSRLCYFLW